ncbi:MAG: sigma-70 family RNA polymerase sigma factor [Planctomycetes bacterium]|nr:sigma-70 family RNA polymerase sigma factor [Planctomycetota bacterium]NUQ34332.1 sigma-70 family RNA polymerase sigma factor [Planctomycetaceae bacterium]
MDEMTSAEIVRRFQADVWSYLRVLGCERNEADDLTQETFVAALRSRFEHRSDGETAAYLRNAARFVFLKSRRAENSRRDTEKALQAERAWARVAGDDGNDSRVDALRACLDTLEARERDLVKARYERNEKGEEIARRLNLTLTVVNTAIHRAKQLLRACMERKSANG